MDSIVNQTLRDIEIICVDDGSSDGSPAILAEYATKDPRVRVVTREHSNAGAARNVGMALATGEYLAFVDSDDWCEPTLYEKAYGAAVRESADLVLWRYALCDGVGVLHEGMFEPKYERATALLNYSLAPWSRMVSRSLVVREGLAFQELPRSNDVYFGAMVMMLAERASLVDEVLYSYRTGMSDNLQARNADTPLAVIEAWAKLVGEWRRRGMVGMPQRTVYSAAVASMLYTLGSIGDAPAYERLWRGIRALHESGGLLEDLTAEDLSNERIRGMWFDILSSQSPLQHLVRRQHASNSEYSALWHRMQDSVEDLEAAQRARRINWKDARRLEGELAAAQKARRINWKDARRLEGELQAMTGELEAKAVELQAMTGELEAKTSELQTMTGELEVTHDELMAKQEEVCALTAELNECRRRIDEFDSSVACRAMLSAVRRLRRRSR